MKEKLIERIKERPEKEAKSPEELREKMKNPEYLPPREEILQAFRGFSNREQWNHEWEKFCLGRKFGYDGEPIYEFFNKEFISALSGYLIKRAKELGAEKGEPVIILEVGAGNGKLSHFLEKEFKEKSTEGVKIIATDSGEDKIEPHFPVEQIPQNKALEKYRPDIVISCWMPYEEDWTVDFRRTESVKEYLLIGESGRWSCCGHPWETWGAKPEHINGKVRQEIYEKAMKDLGKTKYDREVWREESEQITRLKKELKRERERKGIPYKNDGFGKKYLDDISKHQIGRTFYQNEISETVSFGREK